MVAGLADPLGGLCHRKHPTATHSGEKSTTTINIGEIPAQTPDLSTAYAQSKKKHPCPVTRLHFAVKLPPDKPPTTKGRPMTTTTQPRFTIIARNHPTSENTYDTADHICTADGIRAQLFRDGFREVKIYCANESNFNIAEAWVADYLGRCDYALRKN